MITLDLEQGSPEWFQARAGIPTGSGFGKILTPSGQLSDQRESYMLELAGDWLAGKPDDDAFKGYWMDRGNLMEPDARALYEFRKDVEVKTVGFVYQDVLRRCGCSPDGLVGDNGGLEIKSPKRKTHVKNLRDHRMPTVYYPQVQGCMWVCEREWWDFMSYHPDLELMIVRIRRDPGYIRKLEQAVADFLSDLSDLKHTLEVYK